MTETVKNNKSIRIEKALAYLSGLSMKEETIGTHNVNNWFFYSVSEYITVKDTEKQYESHKKYADIQWVVSGEEEIQYIADTELKGKAVYDEVNDIAFFFGSGYSLKQKLVSGCYAIILPNKAHKPGIMIKEPCKVKKIVGKVLMD